VATGGLVVAAPYLEGMVMRNWWNRNWWWKTYTLGGGGGPSPIFFFFTSFFKTPSRGINPPFTL